tara:strand:- start:534 stop:740 length:207 start_codon:yes stop_codon:yes gene_type:complete
MSIRYLSNANGATQKAAAAAEAKFALEQGITQTEAMCESTAQIRGLSTRFEEAFKTGITDEDISNGND